jgi:hypothetical protein
LPGFGLLLLGLLPRDLLHLLGEALSETLPSLVLLPVPG